MKRFSEYYTIHKPEKGESLNNIAKKYQTSVQKIITANPLLNPFIVDSTTRLVIPFNKSIVDESKPYDHEKLKIDLMLLKTFYPFIDTDIIGLSVEGREIYCISFGNGEHTVIYNGAHHGNEWITSLLLMKWLEDLCCGYALNASVKGFDIKNIFQSSKIIIVPMVNPDGVELVINGFNNIKTNQNKLLKMNNYNVDFSNWKANINGVDLNRNYPAGWSNYKNLERYKLNILGPAPSKFAGSQPLSEPESHCLANLTSRTDARLTLSFHSQGEVIYWQYSKKGAPESENIARALSKVSGYKLEDETETEAYGGYKDWCIDSLNKPGFTIEVGSGSNPLEIEQFLDIYEKTETLLMLAAVI